ncbi:hypothetical protein Tco_1051597 [Tanacetum coccineum]
MNPQETQQVIVRDEKWVPSTERVKISPTNVRLETTVHQKEETFQVIIDVIKNSTCFKAFTISAEKCIVNVEVFRMILDICPRVKGEEFTKVQDDDATLTFLIDLGYKGPLHKHTNMYVNHMHQPWRTLAAIINKCLSGKTKSNDKLRKSRIDILWGMFYRENIHQSIINHFLSQHKSLSKLKFQYYHTIKDDGIVSRLKFVRIREDYQEYGLPIPDMMLNDKIKQSDSYQMFLKYFTGLIPPKKSRGKGLQGKKTVDVSQESVDVSDKSEPEPAKKKTSSRSIRGVVIQDTPKQEASDTMQALKECKKTSRRQSGTGGSSEGTGRIPGVPDESTVIFATSSEGTGSEHESEHSEDSQLISDEEEKKNNDGDVDDEDEDDDHISYIQDTNDEDAEIESNEDEIYKYKI